MSRKPAVVLVVASRTAQAKKTKGNRPIYPQNGGWFLAVLVMAGLKPVTLKDDPHYLICHRSGSHGSRRKRVSDSTSRVSRRRPYRRRNSGWAEGRTARGSKQEDALAGTTGADRRRIASFRPGHGTGGVRSSAFCGLHFGVRLGAGINLRQDGPPAGMGMLLAGYWNRVKDSGICSIEQTVCV